MNFEQRELLTIASSILVLWIWNRSSDRSSDMCLKSKKIKKYLFFDFYVYFKYRVENAVGIFFSLSGFYQSVISLFVNFHILSYDF
jgi:hypothetical protein